MHKQGALREFGHYAAMNILGMIGISCYILADTYFVAQGLGSLGLAALNIANTGVQPDERHRPGCSAWARQRSTRSRGRRTIGDRADSVFTHAAHSAAARTAVPARRTVLCKTARGPARRGRADARHDDDLPAHAVVLRAVLRDEQRAAGIHAQRRCADRCHVRHDRGQPVQHRVRLHFISRADWACSVRRLRPAFRRLSAF